MKMVKVIMIVLVQPLYMSLIVRMRNKKRKTSLKKKNPLENTSLLKKKLKQLKNSFLFYQ
jgi:hypothetical protein